MRAVGCLVKALLGFVDRFRFTFYLNPDRASNDVDDDRKWMCVGGRESTWWISNFDQLHLKMIRVQMGQYVSDGDPGGRGLLTLGIRSGLGGDSLGAQQGSTGYKQ